MAVKNSLKGSERLILSRLELDSRMPFSRFGKNIRKSQQQISYTVKSMMDKGIIQKFYTIIDYSKMDVLNFRVYFKVSYISEERFGKLIDFLVSEPHTSWVAACGGRYDLICTFLTQNPSQFNKTLRGMMEKFPEQLQNYIVLTTIVNRYFGRKYLFKDVSTLPQEIFGGDRAPEEIDKTDMKILDELAEDARKNSVTIGNTISLTPKSVIQRIKKLKERKIIRAFRPLLDQRRMGHVSALLLIKYHNVSTEMEDKLIKYLEAHPNVVSIVKTLGEWDIEIRIEAEEAIKLRKMEMEIRQKFALLIQQIESVQLYATYKMNYFPGFLMKNI